MKECYINVNKPGVLECWSKVTEAQFSIQACTSTALLFLQTKALQSKMWRKEFLQFTKSHSASQRGFHLQFICDHLCGNNIHRWYRQFETIGYVCIKKNYETSKVSQEDVDFVRISCLWSPKTSVPKSNLELRLSNPTVWEGFKKTCAHGSILVIFLTSFKVRPSYYVVTL